MVRSSSALSPSSCSARLRPCQSGQPGQRCHVSTTPSWVCRHITCVPVRQERTATGLPLMGPLTVARPLIPSISSGLPNPPEMNAREVTPTETEGAPRAQGCVWVTWCQVTPGTPCSLPWLCPGRPEEVLCPCPSFALGRPACTGTRKNTRVMTTKTVKERAQSPSCENAIGSCANYSHLGPL